MAAATTTSEKSRGERNRRSVFDLPSGFFESCHLLHGLRPGQAEAPYPPPAAVAAGSDGEGAEPAIDTLRIGDKGKESSSSSRWTCNTCKAEFDSLQDQRSHFKSDLHRLNVKLSIAGKSIIKEDDFDYLGGDPLFEDFDVSSISGSEVEFENDPIHNSSLSKKGDKQKLCFHIQSDKIISVWKCLLMKETEDISFKNGKPNLINGDACLEEDELINRLKTLVCEPRDKSHLRIVFLASGGHFVGCVFDGNIVIAHKTFHRYVVRAKAGKQQSAKDATGKVAHSAGSALRRYNEAALKKEVQELLISWKSFIKSSLCIFIYAPSRSHQILFDADKPQFNDHDYVIRHVPLTVHRPTLKEAKRIYEQLTNITYEADESGVPDENSSLYVGHDGKSISEPSLSMLSECSAIKESYPESSSGLESLSIASEAVSVTINRDETTPLHEAAKSGDPQRTLDLLEQGLNPCIKDGRGRTPYMLASEKEVRNTFRRFMALYPDKWDWHAANVPSPLTKELEEAQTAKQAEKDAKRKAKAKELKKLRKAKEKAKAQAALSETSSATVSKAQEAPPTGHKQQPKIKEPLLSKEEEQRRALAEEREKRAAAAERRIAALNIGLSSSKVASASLPEPSSGSSDLMCSCCNASLEGKIPFHRYNYKYCSTSCMHVHREILEDG
ncbi:ankyrin repeat and zinc finger domain-containing protein 1-like [Zingiber officinale]|uniref:ankyrin repeat and zinc finger domain-containing protein 1-like n=1 Tax=Zingiber officinale TaxID=94328 RepID=UPI001C4B4220|nr:ankyrin repeat and zinc finger domain-containing protein 1-like [Zingiber officinale]